MSNIGRDFKQYLIIIKDQWSLIEQIPGVFSYKLNIISNKNLSGAYGFYCELNPQRSALRRPPQVIDLLNPSFDNSKFNFTKIDVRERLVTFKYENSNVTFIINKSPLTKYHSLICVDLEKKLPQKITEESLRFCIQFLLQINDRNFRIGYNSPGAFASVNHLHLHLIYLQQVLFIENVELKQLVDGIYQTANDCSIGAVCFMFNSCEEFFKDQLLKILKFLNWLCSDNIPHNIFMTKDNTKTDRVKVFVFSKEKLNPIKKLGVVNTAFCELSGYIPIGDKTTFNNITEDEIVLKIRAEIGDIHSKICSYILCNLN